MTSAPEDETRRHSHASTPSLIDDPLLRAQTEAQNGLRQFDLGMRIVEDAIAKDEAFRWRASTIFSLHWQALTGLSAYAGVCRPAGVEIEGSEHQPIGSHLVHEEIEKLCDYLNTHRKDRSPIHLAAYAMWRLNWIHPFVHGNGRTSRIFSYVVLCVSLKCVLRGTNTIPEQIVRDRKPYFAALEAADKLTPDNLLQMEALLENLLATQLVSVWKEASGSDVLDLK